MAVVADNAVRRIWPFRM